MNRFRSLTNQSAQGNNLLGQSKAVMNFDGQAFHDRTARLTPGNEVVRDHPENVITVQQMSSLQVGDLGECNLKLLLTAGLNLLQPNH